METTPEGLLTAKEVGDLLKIREASVRRYIRQGKMSAVRLGTKVRIKQSDLQRFIDERTSGADEKPRNS